MAEADFVKVGLLVSRQGRMLLCRKNNTTSKLILPGGTLEPGETPEACLARELREELGEHVRAENLEFLGVYRDRAACDDPTVHKIVEVRLYRGELVGEPVASAEIVELVWFSPDGDPEQLAPSIANKILPDLLARHLLA